MRVKPVFLIMVLCLGAGLVLPGAEESERELTVEELYLKNIEIQILREQAYFNDRELKIMVLDSLEEMIEQGTDGDVVEPVLEFLAMEGIGRKIWESNRLINYFPEVRRRAANLLGRVAGNRELKEKAKNALITVLISDDEPMVKAEAAYGLGVLGINENNEAVRALLYTLEKEDPDRPDNNFAYAICLALEKIAFVNDGIRHPDAYRALITIAQGNYIKTVKRKALQTLDELKKYQY